MHTTDTASVLVVPTEEVLVQRVIACREEMKALKKLLAVSRAAAKAQAMRRERDQFVQPGGEAVQG